MSRLRIEKQNIIDLSRVNLYDEVVSTIGAYVAILYYRRTSRE